MYYFLYAHGNQIERIHRNGLCNKLAPCLQLLPGISSYRARSFPSHGSLINLWRSRNILLSQNYYTGSVRWTQSAGVEQCVLIHSPRTYMHTALCTNLHCRSISVCWGSLFNAIQITFYFLLVFTKGIWVFTRTNVVFYLLSIKREKIYVT